MNSGGGGRCGLWAVGLCAVCRPLKAKYTKHKKALEEAPVFEGAALGDPL